MPNLNFGVQYLVFAINQQHIWATHLICRLVYVTRELYAIAIMRVEGECESLTLTFIFFALCLFGIWKGGI
jgi:hypothetical protein